MGYQVYPTLRPTPFYQLYQAQIHGPLPQLRIGEGLDNQIHPFFKWSNWRDHVLPEVTQGVADYTSKDYDRPPFNYSQDFYQRMAPALQLATVLLSEARHALVRVVCCPLRSGKKFDPNWQPLTDDYRYLDYFLLSLANDVRFFYLRPLQAIGKHDLGTQGVTNRFWTMDPDRTIHKISGVGIAAELIDEIHHDTLWNRKTDPQKATVFCRLAQVLVHEIAHYTYFRTLTFDSDTRTRHLFRLPDKHREPKILPYPFFELGFAATVSVNGFEFGLQFGMMQTRFEYETGTIPTRIRPLYDGSGGIGIAIINPKTRAGRVVNYTLLPNTVVSFFDKTTWKGPPIEHWVVEASDYPQLTYRFA